MSLEKNTSIKIGKYLFNVYSKENNLSEVIFNEKIYYKNLVQIVQIIEIDNPSKFEQQIMEIQLIDRTDYSENFSEVHEKLIKKIKNNPGHYLRKIKSKI